MREGEGACTKSAGGEDRALISVLSAEKVFALLSNKLMACIK